MVWFPLVQLKRSLLGLVSPRPEGSFPEFRLPAARFGDLQRSRSSSSNASEGESAKCSICLADMEEEEAVSELPRCGHVFHLGCIEEWLEKCQFTCPLCRTLLFDRCKISQR
ncbi:hypothetical protein CDL15_Pgr028433 [Punica granatum]|nr:hypothetical protein CDL15_Pgr028433 [Punica granatum]